MTESMSAATSRGRNEAPTIHDDPRPPGAAMIRTNPDESLAAAIGSITAAWPKPKSVLTPKKLEMITAGLPSPWDAV